MNQFELHLMYKNETSFAHEPITAVAFISKKSKDIILDSSDYIDPRIIEQLPHDNSGREATIEFPDPEYHKWIESKIIEMIAEVNDAKYLHDYKSDYEDAKYRIGQLEDQLDQANDEIYEFKK
jgi:hypothetical protein